MEKNRDELPFRKNCEGYFVNDDNEILAKIMPFGLIFPGGGVESFESADSAMLRETLEETGAIISNLKFIKSEKLIWSKDWAKTQKQKSRYEQFKGDEMFFFTGNIENFQPIVENEEDTWTGEKLMKLSEVLELLKQKEKREPCEYTRHQINILEDLQNV